MKLFIKKQEGILTVMWMLVERDQGGALGQKEALS